MQKPIKSKFRQFVQKYVNKLMEEIENGWLILTGLYFAVLILIFLGIWKFIEPFSVPDKISETQGILSSRPFLHFLLALVLASHFSLFTAIFALKKSISELKKRKYNTDDTRKVLLIAGNLLSIKLMDTVDRLGYKTVALYDQRLGAEGLQYAREKGIPTFTNNSDELREMLKIVRYNQEDFYFIFLPTDNPRWRPSADEIIRGLRKETKNFRYYRLGFDFDENIDEEEIETLLKSSIKNTFNRKDNDE